MQDVIRKPWLAMFWELWRVSRYDLLLRFGGAITMLILMAALASNLNDVESATFQSIVQGLALMLLSVAAVCSTTWMGDLDNQNTGYTFRLGFTRPISNFQLVCVPMAYSVLVAMVGYLSSAYFAQTIFGLYLPTFSVAILLGWIVCIFTSVTWASTHALEKLIGLFAALLAIIGAFALRHSFRDESQPILLAIGSSDYFRLNWIEYLGLALTATAAIAATVQSVQRQRYGEGLRWLLVPARVWQVVMENRALTTFTKRLDAWMHIRNPRGPLVAQFWFEARRSGHIVHAAIFFTLLAFAFIALVPLLNATWGGVHSARMWVGCILCCPLLYQILATDPLAGLQRRQGAAVLSAFDATRPLRGDQLMAIKLVTVGAWSTFGCFLMALVAALHTTLMGHWPYWEALLQSTIDLLPEHNVAASQLSLRNITLKWWCLGSCNLILVYFCSTAMLMTFVFAISKSHKLFAGAALLFFAHLGLWAWDISHGQPLKNLWWCYAYLLPILALLASLYLVITAIHARILSTKYFCGVVCIWIAFLTTTWLISSKLSSILPEVELEPVVYLWLIGGLALPFATAAAAPLAHAAFRHS
ncbi:MAG: hypothetical protein R3C53_25415 [Pirellulaceae bacterium]